MSTEIHVFSRAEKNLSDAYKYYENESPGLGEIFLLRFQEILENIAEYPMMYPKVHGEVRRGLFHRFPYAVFYIYEQGEAIVLHVFNTKQDIETLLEASS